MLGTFQCLFHNSSFLQQIFKRIMIITKYLHISRDFPGGSDGKASAYNAGDLGLIPGSGRSSGEGNGNPLQYSCLENPMDGRAWQATVRGVAKSQTSLSNFTLPYLTLPFRTFLLLFICSVILLFQKMFFYTTLFYESFLLSLILSLYIQIFHLIKYFLASGKKKEFLLCSSCYC